MSGAVLTSGWTGWVPWTDKKGRLHPLRAVTFGLLVLPGLWLAVRYALGMLGARALYALILGAGYWGVWLLLVTLAITPAKAIFGVPSIAVVRRMIGNASLAYILTHLTLYIIDQQWKLGVVASEIVQRIYLTIGFVALLGLISLGVTSTDRAVRRMGKRWKRLHRLVYGITILALIHYTLQRKADVSMPLLGEGVFYWLMMWRLLPAGRDRGPVALLGLAVASALLTLLTEWGWYRFGTRIDPMRVLRAELDIAFGLRPAGQALALGLLVLAAAQLRRLALGRTGQQVWFWIVLFAAGAGVHELAAFMFGFERFDEGEGWYWLWQDVGWAALLGGLGLVRWLARLSPNRWLVDAIGLACAAYLVVLAASSLRAVEMALTVGLAMLWAALARQTWHISRLTAVMLVPMTLLLAYGLVGLM